MASIVNPLDGATFPLAVALGGVATRATLGAMSECLTSGGPLTVLRPSPRVKGAMFCVFDLDGDAATNPITVDGDGDLIDGAASVQLSTAGAVGVFLYDGAQWLRLVPRYLVDGARNLVELASQTMSGGGCLTDAELRASPVPVSAGSLPLPTGAATDAGLAAIFVRQGDGSQHVAVDSLPAVNVGLTDAELRASAVPVHDHFASGEALADQAGAGAALTFTFSASVQLVWVRCDGGVGRADPFGGTPTGGAGIYCEDGTPNPMTVQCTTVKVFAGVGTTVRVWGFRE